MKSVTMTPMTPQTPEEIATIVADLVGKPVAEIYTNPASPALAERYFADVAAFVYRSWHG